MALRFDPGLESEGSRTRERKQKNKRSGGSGARSRSAGSGKRTSVGDKARASAQRASKKASREGSAPKTKPTSGERGLDKLRKKNAKQAGKKEGTYPERSAKRGSRDSGTRRAERVGDIRARERAERAQRAKAQYRRYVARILFAIAGVLIIVFGAIFVYRSDVLLVRNVQVEGTSHLTGQEITQLAAVPEDATMLRVDTDGIVGRLKENAWVQEADVTRNFPDGITIHITERTPGAVVKISDKKTWVVSSDGTWLSAATAQDWDTQMRVVDVSAALAAPVSGSDCNDGGIKNALAILQAVSPDLKDQISDISAESSVKTALNLKNGVTVAFGDSNEAQLKEAGIWALLDQYKGKVSYINVRVPSRPTFRTLDD